MVMISLGKIRRSIKATAQHIWSTDRRSKLRRAIRHNRVLLVTLLAVGGVVALLTGISLAQGEWYPQVLAAQAVPTPRFGAATTYDTTKQEVLIFGGFVGTTSASNIGTLAGPPIVSNGDTWVYKSQKWQRRSPIQTPSPRGFAAMAYDGARKNAVLFGGAPYRSNTVSDETWTWDGETRDWILQHPPEPIPDARQNAVMVYDAHRRVVVMFGGRDADGKPMDDTWTWDGSAWKIMPKAGSPSPRYSAAMAYDVCRAEAVMFGGIGDPINNFAPQPGETWTWDGSKWTQKSPLVSPPRRIGASMTYGRSGMVLLYGGLHTNDAGVSTAATDTDIWRWNGAGPTGWEKMGSEAGVAVNVVLAFAGGDGKVRLSPPPRAYASFTQSVAADATSDGPSFETHTLFGGTPSEVRTRTGVVALDNAFSNVPQIALGDHFQFSEPGAVNADGLDGSSGAGVPTTPLARKCTNPVPLPSDGTAIQIDPGAESRSKVTAREGMREIGQLPVLIGTDWPSASRNTHVGPSNNRTPNPNYTPAPDCPNSSGGETGLHTHLVTDQKRNRIYQFFVCDRDRGISPQGSSLPSVGKFLIEAYDGTTLKALGRVVIGVGSSQSVDLGHDIEGGRFFQRNSDFIAGTTINELLVLDQSRIEKGIDPVVKKIDLTGAPSFQLGTIFPHPKTGRIKAFFGIAPGGATAGPPPSTSTPPKLGLWDVEDRREDWRVDVPGCEVAAPVGKMMSGNRVYATCNLANNYYAVVRIPITEGAGGAETAGPAEPPFRGPYSTGAFGATIPAWGDPKTERVLLLASGGYAGGTLWVFDGKVSRYVGRVGISPSNAATNFGGSRGFDGEAGRLYFQFPDEFVDKPGGYLPMQGGLLAVDTGLTPAPQPLKFPQFSFSPGSPTIASLSSAPGVPRRVFIRKGATKMKKYPDGETVKMANEMFYRVVADEVPVPNKSDLAQLDALTIPVAEQPGKTEVSFDAEGSGYGIRLRSVGGIWSAVRPFSQAYDGANGQQWEELALAFSKFAVPACVFPDRELIAGWVPQARLSDLDALARSSGLEVDSNSKTDLQAPLSRCNPTANASNLPPSARVVFDTLWPLWQMVQSEGNKAASQGTAVETGKDADGKCGEIKQPTPAGEVIVSDCTETPAGTLSRGQNAQGNPTVRYQSTTSSWDSHFKEVECVGDALKDYRAAVGNIYGSAKCIQTKGKVEAAARGSATGSGPLAQEISSRGFSVAEGYSTVEVTREPNGRGVVVTSTAVAKGIQLPGVSFGAGNLASLSIDRVETRAMAWSNGSPSDPLENPRATFERKICGVHTPDGSIPGCLTSDHQQTLVNNWNTRWGVNSKMYLPKYDPDYYIGSPGGYIAGVIKPIADEVEDQIFAKDFQREVSGLVIEFNKDSATQGSGRQVLQLAAVRAVAGLGVQCNPDLVYSSSTNDCVALPDDLLEEEFFEDEEEEFFEEEEELDGEWTEVEAIGLGESLGSKIGKLLDRLPVIRQLPIRQMGEALLSASVWVLLGLPLLFAWRRLSLLNPSP